MLLPQGLCICCPLSLEWLFPLIATCLPQPIYLKWQPHPHPPYSDFFYFTEYITIWHYIFIFCCCHPSLEYKRHEDRDLV